VVIASSTRKLTGRALFEYRDLGTVALKGFADVPAWQVIGSSAAESRFEARPLDSAERRQVRVRELGWIPGETLRIDYRHGSGEELARIEVQAAELVKLEPDVLVAGTTSGRESAPTSSSCHSDCFLRAGQSGRERSGQELG
jgi:hypothetical protein